MRWTLRPFAPQRMLIFNTLDGLGVGHSWGFMACRCLMQATWKQSPPPTVNLRYPIEEISYTSGRCTSLAVAIVYSEIIASSSQIFLFRVSWLSLNTPHALLFFAMAYRQTVQICWTPSAVHRRGRVSLNCGLQIFGLDVLYPGSSRQSERERETAILIIIDSRVISSEWRWGAFEDYGIARV